ncbi:MAG: flagellar motor switch protein FliG [Thermodesulfobacteriota bacterium]
MASKRLKGMDKAAILLSNLGEDLASEVIKFLTPADIQMIGRRITSIQNIESDTFFDVMEEFKQHVDLDSGPSDADEYVKNIILKALGPEKAGSILKRISKKPEEGGLDTLKWMDPKVVAEFVKKEHPQTIAVIMANLSPEQAAQVFVLLDQRTRSDVMLRVATLEPLAPGAMEELEEAINQNLSGAIGLQTSTLGGVKIAAEILNQIDSTTESEILTGIESQDANLATEIQEQMFVFADIVNIDERGIQRILKDISNDQLILALKTAEETLKDKFLGNMSERAREMLLDEMETRGPVRLSEVDQAQLEIVRVTRRLAQDGEVTIMGGESSDVLV